MTTNIETAVGEIKQYAHRELDLLRQKSEKQIELKSAEQAGGDALLDGDNNDSIERAVRLQVELRQIDMAIGSCRARRLAAVQQKLDGEIQEFRARSVEARQQAADITTRTRPHLDALREIEGVDYVPQVMPQSAHAASRAGALEREAQQRESRGIERHGNVQIDGVLSIDEIALAVLEVAADGPTAAEVIRWVETREHRDQFDKHRLSVRISWADGAITAGSYIRLLEPLETPAAATPEEVPPPANSQLRTPSQFFGHAARPVPQETRG
jgi:hypothetical protein